ncbi:MAG TPA: TetR/AcrR family transcriptional regulator [Isosphaeraceae bacterium]|nr:TetR/AcrR family transcriptional regulator [Isosphaeraceae bacterium]
MSPRPRKASDEEIFAAAHRIMQRLGPAQWTLADIAAEAGLTAGALVQRFGSKRDLLVTLTEQVVRATPQMMAQLRAGHASPLDALRAYAECIAQMGESPGVLAHHLAYLQLDLTDPDLHKQVRAQAKATRAAIREWLEEAVALGELEPSVDTVGLARAVEVTLSGSLMTWAFYQDGPAARWVLDDLEAVLRRDSSSSVSASKQRQASGTKRGNVAAPAVPHKRKRRGGRGASSS